MNDMNDINDMSRALTEESQIRRHWYQFLSTVFASALSDKQHAALRVMTIDDEDGDTALNNNLNSLIDKAKKLDTQQIKSEYDAVFIGMGRGEAVPYASWHLTGFLMERPLADIRSDMRILGLTRNEDHKEPEDGIAYLLDSMAHLALRPINVQQDFFNNHIATWVDDFIAMVNDAPSASFYKDAAQLLKEWMNIERQYFNQELRPPET